MREFAHEGERPTRSKKNTGASSVSKNNAIFLVSFMWVCIVLRSSGDANHLVSMSYPSHAIVVKQMPIYIRQLDYRHSLWDSLMAGKQLYYPL